MVTLHFPFQLSPEWAGGLLATYTIEVLTNVFQRNGVHMSTPVFVHLDLSIRASSPIVLEDDEAWTSISILLRTLTDSDGF